MQGRDEQSSERCRIGHVLVLFDPADLCIAVPNLNGEFALGEFFTFAQIFEQVAKGGKFFRRNGRFAQCFSLCVWTDVGVSNKYNGD